MTDDRLSAYLDDELDPEERAEVEVLLASSPERRAELDAVAEARSLLRSLPAVDPPAAASDDGVVVPLRPRRVPRGLLAVGAVAAVAVLIVGLFSLFGGSSGPPIPGLDDLVVRHAEAIEVGEGSGYVRMDVVELSDPGMAPDDIGSGMVRTAIYKADDGTVQVMYSDGEHDLSVFQQDGDMDVSSPYEAEMEGNAVTVVGMDGHVVTIVADAGMKDMTDDVMRALPT